jgi:hypothetical protein
MSTQAERFASCVKKIKENFKPKLLKKTKKFTDTDKEGIAIAICTKSILWPQGRTLKSFSMKDGKPNLITQPKKVKAGRRTLRRSTKRGTSPRANYRPSLQ